MTKEASGRVFRATLRNTRLQRARHVVPVGKALDIGQASVYRVLEVAIEGPGAG